MASLSLLCCVGNVPGDLFSSKMSQTSSLVSSSSSSHANKFSSNGFRSSSRKISFAGGRRSGVLPCSSCLVHEAEMWSSILPQLKSYYWFLLYPSILVPLFALSSESAHRRRRVVAISDSELKLSVVSNLCRQLVGVLRSCRWQWQEVQRGVIQITTVLLLANAFHSDIAAPNPYDTFENVPQDISGGEVRKRIQRPKSKKAEGCTQKCVGTCVRGGAGSPGEGPFNIRKPLVVFKEGFRSRQYCLIECSDICNLIGDGDDGP